MISPSIPAADPAPDLHAAALARAERRRATLERLTEIGMELAEEIRERNVQAPLHPEPRHDPCRGFAVVSRAVRLTVALEGKVEEQIVALRNGEVPTAPVWLARPMDAGGTPAVQGGLQDRRRPAGFCPDDREEHEADRRECETERLVESESDGFRFSGGFNADVDAMSADLNLPPRHGEGHLGEAERGGDVGIHPKSGDDPDSPTPDFASLRLDPPQVGEGGEPDATARSAGFQPALLL